MIEAIYEYAPGQIDGVSREEFVCEVSRWEYGPGREKATAAFFHDTAIKLLAFNGHELVGVASYRIVDDFIKRINMGVKYPKTGIGSALVARMIVANPGKPMFSKSIPEAWGFCAALGMRYVMDFGDKRNRRMYLWSAAEAADFLKRRTA